MNVLILNGSPRRGGSTERMAEAFAEGAREAGHRVTILPVGRMRINGCMGCEYCHTRGGGQCVQRDDEAEVYAALAEAEVLVLASPIYYYTLSAQLQAALHRTYAVGIPPRVRQTALLLSSGSPGVYDAAIGQYRSAVVEYFGVRDLGVMTVNERENPVERNLDALRAFGRSVGA